MKSATLQRIFPAKFCFIATVTLLLLMFNGGFASAQNFTVLHEFTGGVDGSNPYSSLTIDRVGNLYGVAPFWWPPGVRKRRAGSAVVMLSSWRTAVTDGSCRHCTNSSGARTAPTPSELPLSLLTGRFTERQMAVEIQIVATVSAPAAVRS